MLAGESAGMLSTERRMSPPSTICLPSMVTTRLPPPQARLVCRRPLGHALDEVAAHVVRHVEQVEHVLGEELALRAAPERLLRQEELLGRLHGHHEAQP